MQLENRFDVPASPEAAWTLLNDVPAVLPCMPGAELVEVVDTDRWKARLQVRLGPISLQFLADLSRETTDLPERRAVISVDAREAKGRGTARATITSAVEEATAGASVSIVTELALRGPLAQYGRPIVAPVAEQLTEQFATCITKKLTSTPSKPEDEVTPQQTATSTETSEPLDGVRLLLAALRRALTRGRAT
jgi:carbon monoxide dehydrogenase subunit G